MKKIILLIIIFILIPIQSSAHELYKDGWHSVRDLNKANKYVWGYYKNGIEKKRVSLMIFTHQGWGDAPANSIASFKRTLEEGFYGFETDIRFTKDNVPVLIHNDTINYHARNNDSSLSKIRGCSSNCGNSKVYVKDLTYSQLTQYSFCVSRDGKVLNNYRNNKISKFEDAVVFAKENGMTIRIELKEGTKEQIASVVKIVKKYDMDNVVRWTSSFEKLLAYVNEADDDEYISIIPGDQSDEELLAIRKRLKTANNVVLNLDLKNTSVSVPNLPDPNYVASKYVTTTIPQGKIQLEKNEISLSNGDSINIRYTYDGDGIVKCDSSKESYVTCQIDSAKKMIKVTGVKEFVKNKTINIYATQGVKYSATLDTILTITPTTKPTSTSTTVPTATNNVLIIGDVDGNGKVGVSDYLLIRKYLLKISLLEEDELKRADVNSDGEVTPKDYNAIRRIILGFK